MSKYRAMRFWIVLLLWAIVCGYRAWPVVEAQAPYNPNLYSGLKWRMLGPFRGGRVDAVSGVVGRRTSSTSALSTAACGRRSTPAGSGCRSSIRSPLPRLARWRWHRRRRTRFTPARGSPPCVTRWATAMACTSPPTAPRHGRTSASTTRSTSAELLVDLRMPTSCLSPRLGISTRPAPSAASFGRRMAAGHGRMSCSRATARRGRRRDRSDRTRAWSTRPCGTRGVRLGTRIRPSNGPGGGIFKSIDGGATWKQLATVCRLNASAGPGLAVPAAIRGVSMPWSMIPLPRARREHAVSGSPPARGGGRLRGSRRRTRWPRSSAGRANQAAPRNRAGSIVPMMRARHGPSCRAIRRSSDEAGTSNTSRSIRGTLTSSMCRTSSVSRSKDGGRTWDALRGSPGGDDYQGAWVSPDDRTR